MWEGIAGIIVTSDALEGTPYARQGRKETQQARVGRIAHIGIVPARYNKTKKDFNILPAVSLATYNL